MLCGVHSGVVVGIASVEQGLECDTVPDSFLDWGLWLEQQSPVIGLGVGRVADKHIFADVHVEDVTIFVGPVSDGNA